MHDGYDLSAFHEQQGKFVKEVQDLLTQTGKSQMYKIDPSTIATNIEDKRAGKARGVDRLLTILQDKGIDTHRFLTFGDSTSDLAMADALEQKGKVVTFVYTGEKERLGEVKKPYPIVFSKGYSQGTLEFLKHLSVMDRSRN